MTNEEKQEIDPQLIHLKLDRLRDDYLNAYKELHGSTKVYFSNGMIMDLKDMMC